eukprot:340168_1
MSRFCKLHQYIKKDEHHKYLSSIIILKSEPLFSSENLNHVNPMAEGLQQTIANVKKQLSVLKTYMKEDDNKYDIIDDVLDEVEANEHKYQNKLTKFSTTTHSSSTIKLKNLDAEAIDDKPKKNDEFWKTLKKELKDGDIDFVKDLVRTKELSMDETDTSNRTLLMLATEFGLYELVSMCINLGADIDHQDISKKTALKIATES